MNITTRAVVWARSLAIPRSLPSGKANRARDRRRTAAATLAIGAAAFVVLQLGLGLAGELLPILKDPGYGDKELKLARQVRAHAGAPSVVMLGTSRTGAGFQAGLVREQLAPVLDGKAMAFNFGIPASGPITHILYLRRLFADGHRPDLLLLEVLPPTLADAHPMREEILSGIPSGPLEARFLFGERLQRDEVEVAIGYGFPDGAVRQRWRESLLIPWYTLRFPILGRIAPSALPWYLRYDWSRTGDEYGWGAPPILTVTPEEYAAGLARARGEYGQILRDLDPTGGGARALADLLALCRQRGIPVRLVLMPEAVGFRALYPPAANDRLDRFLNQLCAEYRCELVDARGWLPDSAFSDGHHLLKPGAEAFSGRLVRDVIVPYFRGR